MVLRAVPKGQTICSSLIRRLYELPDVTLSLKVLPAEQPQAEPEKRWSVELKGWWHGAAPTMEVPRAAQSRACWAVLSAMHCPGSKPPHTSKVCSSPPPRNDNKHCLELRSSKLKDRPGASQTSLTGFPKAPKSSSEEANAEDRGGCHSMGATATRKR